MAVKSLLAAMVITGTEQNTVEGVTPFGDATGSVSSWLAAVDQLVKDITYLNANMPSGTNKTNLASVISALSA